jgi:hypothetical protein
VLLVSLARGGAARELAGGVQISSQTQREISRGRTVPLCCRWGEDQDEPIALRERASNLVVPLLRADDVALA